MNNIFSLPPQIQHILQTLEQAGQEAFVVGGCVRDMLLGKQPGDYDICTSALPEETMALFDRCIPTGIAHGTVTVLYEGCAAEVTTFRQESDYTDHRHPDSVCFTRDIAQDLGRRDFTVNAMAMDLRGTIRDPYEGRKDLSVGILRCVGDPDKRFREDALRMLRGLRFSAQLGFSIEENTLRAMERNAPYIEHVAAERVLVELTKALLSDRPQVIGDMIQMGLLNRFVRPVETVELRDIADLPADRQLRFARLMKRLTDCGAVTDTEQTMRALRMDKATIYAVKTALAMDLPHDIVSMKQLMSRADDQTVTCVCALGDYNRLHGLRNAILNSKEPYAMSQLAVTGKDLNGLGIKGTAVGETLRRLLDAVIERPEMNEKATLLEIANHR